MPLNLSVPLDQYEEIDADEVRSNQDIVPVWKRGTGWRWAVFDTLRIVNDNELWDAPGEWDGDRVLTIDDVNTAHTNTGATGIVTLTLPAAIVGLRFMFARTEPYELRVAPHESEQIGEGGAGKYVGLIDDNSVMGIRCLKAGAWVIDIRTSRLHYEDGQSGYLLDIGS